MTDPILPVSAVRPRWAMSHACWEAWQQQAPNAWALFEAQGAPVNGVDEDGWTPIRWALHTKNMDVLNRLIERGADLWVTSRENGTLVEQAFTERNPDMAVRLLTAGSPLATTEGAVIAWVHDALTWNHEALLLMLLDHPDLPANYSDRHGRTELHHLITSTLPLASRVALIPRLVERGNPINALDPDGYTALHLVLRWGMPNENLALLVPLMDAGASLSVRTGDGLDLDAVGLALHRGNLDARSILETHALTRAMQQDSSASPSVEAVRDRPRL